MFRNLPFRKTGLRFNFCANLFHAMQVGVILNFGEGGVAPDATNFCIKATPMLLLVVGCLNAYFLVSYSSKTWKVV